MKKYNIKGFVFYGMKSIISGITYNNAFGLAFIVLLFIIYSWANNPF